MGFLLISLIVLLIIATIPRWRYSRTWGYSMSNLMGMILLIVVLEILLGCLPLRF